MWEHYSDLRKPMINGLFRHARGCFFVKTRNILKFAEKYPQKYIWKMIQLPCWWNQSKSMNIKRAVVYFILKAFIKLLNEKPQKNNMHIQKSIWGLVIYIKKNKFYLLLLVSCSKIFLFYFFEYFYKYFQKNWNLGD